MTNTPVESRILFFSSAGKRLDSMSWIEEAARIGDVALVYYGEDERAPPPGVRYYFRRRDFKIPNFLELLRTEPGAFDYQTYVFIDDDIIFEPGALTRWIEVHTAEALDLSQPSLTSGSKSDWPHLKHQGSLDVDRRQFVEIQCFAISRRALQLSLPYFFMVRTGAGLDIALCHLSQAKGLQAAVIHSVQMVHPHRPEAETVRQQFDEFAQFNREMNRFLRFCFDGPQLYVDLAAASTTLGDTRPHIVRTLKILRFVGARLARVARRLLLRGSR